MRNTEGWRGVAWRGREGAVTEKNKEGFKDADIILLVSLRKEYAGIHFILLLIVPRCFIFYYA